MTLMTQVLLIISYVILGLAVALSLPILTATGPQTASILGVVTFFSMMQVQNWFLTSRKEKDLMERLERLEDMAAFMRSDLERTRRDVDSRTRSTAAQSETLVGELKLLHTLLAQVSRKEKELQMAAPEEAVAASASASPAPAAEAVDLALAQEAAIAARQSRSKSEEDETPVGDADSATALENAGQMESDEADAETLDLTQEEMALTAIDGEDVAEREVAPGGDEIDALLAPDDLEDTQPEEQIIESEVVTARGALPSAPAVGGETRKRAPIRLIKREDQLLSVVRSSLAENRVDLYLQPVVGLPSRNPSHYECFSRVRDEEGRIILPRQYMKVAESKGLISTIDNLLLFRLIQLVRRLGPRRPDIRFFCNMSSYSMQDDEFFPQFIEFMMANEEFANRLVFEISQEDFTTIDDDILERLMTLGRRGFAFSMDHVNDFEMDFAMLGKQHFQFIKSDLSDLVGTHEQDDIPVLKSFLRRNGIQLVASRIENEADVLEALDCEIEYAQGYLFGEPSAATELNREL